VQSVQKLVDLQTLLAIRVDGSTGNPIGLNLGATGLLYEDDEFIQKIQEPVAERSFRNLSQARKDSPFPRGNDVVLELFHGQRSSALGSSLA